MTITNQHLIQSGFEEKRYEGQEGVFYTKQLKAREMDCVREQLVDDIEVFLDSNVVVEATPDKRVQLYIADADHLEGPFPLESEEALLLLKDAGFKPGK